MPDAPLRVGILSAAHVHAPSFAACLAQNPRVQVAGVWDDDVPRGEAFADHSRSEFFASREILLEKCDAVVVCSENLKHGELLTGAVARGLHVLCEKPVAASADELATISSLKPRRGQTLATAFPCPFSPGFKELSARVASGETGAILAVAATNQGTCPFGWFVEPGQSGGGAMIDHVVHVADLLRRLLGSAPGRIQAEVGNRIYGQDWEDTAMVSLGYPNGVFATIDSSWSKPKGYKTWGNVKLTVVCTQGVLEADLFVQGVDVYTAAGHHRAGSASNLDSLMVDNFVAACLDGTPPASNLEDGIEASKIALKCYESVSSGSQPVAF